MASIFNLKALGLSTQPNQLETPPGSLTIAKNVIITRDNVVESRRGFSIYGNSFGSTSDRAKQLLNYKERILRHYGSTLQFDDGVGNFSSFSGSYSETQPGLRIKSIEANGNLYFTTSDGIKKISAQTADDFTTSSGYVTDSGAAKAVDISGDVNYNYGDQSSFLTQDSAVAYRVVWAYRDLNNNLFLGTPSQRTEIYNSMLTLMLQDYMVLLGALDNIGRAGALINDQNYVNTLKLGISASASDLRTNLISLAQKIDEDILYADNDGAPLEIDSASVMSGVCTITFASGTATDYLSSGSLIFLAGFSPTSGTINGAQTVSTVSASQITFNTAVGDGAVTIDPSATIVSNEYRSIAQPGTPDIPATHTQLQDIQDYITLIIEQLNLEPIAVIGSSVASEYIEPLDVTTASTVNLNITIPENINNNYFFQIYRSAVFSAIATDVLSIDIFPNDELQLVYEAFPTSAEITAGFIEIEDIVPDAFRGANLYTNAATGEGILQANDIPPFAKDINVFKNSVFYANTRTRHRKNLSLLGVQSMIEEYNAGTTPQLTIASEDIFHTYKFILGESETFDIICAAGSTLASSGTADYFLVNSGNNEKQYYFWYKIGTATDPLISDRIGVSILADSGDTNTDIAEKTRDAFNILNSSFTATSSTNTVSVTCVDTGVTDDVEDGTTGFTFNITNQGQGEQVSQEQTLVITVADIASSLAGTYFTLNTAFNQIQYYIWFKVNGVGIDPAVSGKTGILVNLAENDSAAIVAQKIEAELSSNYSDDFAVTINSNELTITNIQFGEAINSTAGTSGFTVSILQEGALNVLLSTNLSPARAVEITANSLTRVINQNDSETVYSFYTSGAQEVPGRMLLENRNLNNSKFYLNTNTVDTGNSFNPPIFPDVLINSIATGSPSSMLVTTSTPHGLSNLDYIILSGTDSAPSIDGYRQITYVSPTTFRINVEVTGSGTKGAIVSMTNAESSSNEEAKNRVYYSKFQQPESVPILNYFDVGAKDKAILRIFPLRDSLFVFKEDGLYRISGEAIPFNLALFDSGVILVAPDSVSSLSNIIYSWTRQGITSVTESGANIISRPIYATITSLSSANYPNFSTSTWGIGYESDNSYTVFTVENTFDTSASIGYRFDALTSSWTTIDKDYTCGVINSTDDKMYVGAGDTNFLEKERKTFTREDYADREYSFTLEEGRLIDDVIILDNVMNIETSDVFIQDQTLTIYEFNALLKKLDLDPGTTSSDYLSSLEAFVGDDLKDKLVALAAKLDLDGLQFTNYESTIENKTAAITGISAGSPVTITSVGHGLITGRKILISGTDSIPTINEIFTVTVTGTDTFTVDTSVITPGTSGTFTTQDADFDDLRVCYNAIIDKLNSDSVISFSNYKQNTQNTIQETLIVNVDRVAKRITLNQELDLVVGNFDIYKSIDCEIQYSPNTFGGDPVSLKHIREAQLMFEDLAFTRGIISFATDLLPGFEEVPFNADSSGLFGFTSFGLEFFGGVRHAAPIRTYIPRNAQRCRYMVIKFNHRVAREKWSLFGITLTGETELSSRAYR